MQEYWLNIYDDAGSLYGDVCHRRHAEAVDALVYKYPNCTQHQIKVGYSHTVYVRRGVPGVPDILQIHDLTADAAEHARKLDADENDGRGTRGRGNTYNADAWVDELRRDYLGSVL